MRLEPTIILSSTLVEREKMVIGRFGRHLYAREVRNGNDSRG